MESRERIGGVRQGVFSTGGFYEGDSDEKRRYERLYNFVPSK